MTVVNHISHLLADVSHTNPQSCTPSSTIVPQIAAEGTARKKKPYSEKRQVGKQSWRISAADYRFQGGQKGWRIKDGVLTIFTRNVWTKSWEGDIWLFVVFGVDGFCALGFFYWMMQVGLCDRFEQTRAPVSLSTCLGDAMYFCVQWPDMTVDRLVKVNLSKQGLSSQIISEILISRAGATILCDCFDGWHVNADPCVKSSQASHVSLQTCEYLLWNGAVWDCWGGLGVSGNATCHQMECVVNN